MMSSKPPARWRVWRLWALLRVAAVASGEAALLANFGVVVRPRALTGARTAMLRRLRAQGVGRARLLGYGRAEVRATVDALGAGARVAVSIPDGEVARVGASAAAAAAACEGFARFARRGAVDLVVVGVTPPSGVGADVGHYAALANATRSLSAACAAAGAPVAVSTAFALNVLRSSYPPSASLFAAPGALRPVLEHLRATRSPFLVELDPYVAWSENYYGIDSDYALFGRSPDAPAFVDNGVGYWNLYDAMLDAVRWALDREGFGDLEVSVARVGWPSGGGLEPTDGASAENAARFASALAARAATAGGAFGKTAVVYAYEADDAPDGSRGAGGLQWGVCGASGRPKYDLATGAVFSPLFRGTRSAAAPGYGPGLALLLGAAAAALAAARAAKSALGQRSPGIARHSPSRVRNIVRAASAEAEKTLRDERSLRERSNPTPLQCLLSYGRRLPTVAESPIASDGESGARSPTSASSRSSVSLRSALSSTPLDEETKGPGLLR